MSIDNREDKTEILVPTSEHSFTEPKQFRLTASSVQPALVSNDQAYRDPPEQMSVSLSNSQCDSSAMIDYNVSLRYA